MAEIILKDIPKPLFQRLKQKAIQNHRSLDTEVIATLELVYRQNQVDVEGLLQRAGALRSQVLGQLTDDQLTELKNQGRS
jgi:antitoxin FitA